MENKAGRVRWMQRLKKKVQNNKKKILSCLLIVFIYFVFFPFASSPGDRDSHGDFRAEPKKKAKSLASFCV